MPPHEAAMVCDRRGLHGADLDAALWPTPLAVFCSKFNKITLNENLTRRWFRSTEIDKWIGANSFFYYLKEREREINLCCSLLLFRYLRKVNYVKWEFIEVRKKREMLWRVARSRCTSTGTTEQRIIKLSLVGIRKHCSSTVIMTRKIEQKIVELGLIRPGWLELGL